METVETAGDPNADANAAGASVAAPGAAEQTAPGAAEQTGSGATEQTAPGATGLIARSTGELIASSNGIEIAYEAFGDEGAPVLLLIMGLGTQMLGWDDRFCSLLASRGYRVVRFDNRDIGHSGKMVDASVPGRLPMLLGFGRPAYRLGDMADDSVGVLDHLGVESAHIAGASMGGMIAQEVAIRHPERARSLTSIMSMTSNRLYGTPTLAALLALIAPPGTNRETSIERSVKTFTVIGSPGFERDLDHLRDIAGRSYDRSHYWSGIARQLHAVTTARDRASHLHRLDLPAAVIHGTKDPLVRPIAGRATARAIPGAKLTMIEGMGHDLPEGAWPQIADSIVETAEAGDAGRAPRNELQAESAT